MNSISIAPDRNLIVSMRNTSATYKIDRRSGQVIWRLGGKDSSFALPPGTGTAFQHDVIGNGRACLRFVRSVVVDERAREQSCVTADD